MIEWPSALGLGCLAAFLYSLKQVNPVFRFEIDAFSWIILIGGTVIAWLAIRNLFRSAEKTYLSGENLTEKEKDKRSRNRVLLFCLILGGAMMFSLLYSLRDIPASKRFDVTVGVFTALIFISAALYFFWRLVNFLERHGQPEEPEKDPDDHS